MYSEKCKFDKVQKLYFYLDTYSSILQYLSSMLLVAQSYSLFLQNEKKWKQLAELAIKNCEFQLAQECLHRAEDFGGLLLLASSAGHADMIAKLAESALEKGKNNVAFLAYYLLGR